MAPSSTYAAESRREVAAELRPPSSTASARRREAQAVPNPPSRTGARLLAAALLKLAGLVVAGWYGFVCSALTCVAGFYVLSIAVLPCSFDDLSPNKSLGYFGDGMSEDIITMLSRFPDLAVVARNSSFVYKGKLVDSRIDRPRSQCRLGARRQRPGKRLIGFVSQPSSSTRIPATTPPQRPPPSTARADRYDKTGKRPAGAS